MLKFYWFSNKKNVRTNSLDCKNIQGISCFSQHVVGTWSKDEKGGKEVTWDLAENILLQSYNQMLSGA